MSEEAGWKKVGLFLPDAWHEWANGLARDVRVDVLSVYVAALDRLACLPLEDQVRLVTLFARLPRPELAAARPGDCGKMVEQWATETLRLLRSPDADAQRDAKARKR